MQYHKLDSTKTWTEGVQITKYDRNWQVINTINTHKQTAKKRIESIDIPDISPVNKVIIDAFRKLWLKSWWTANIKANDYSLQETGNKLRNRGIRFQWYTILITYRQMILQNNLMRNNLRHTTILEKYYSYFRY